MEQLFHKIQFNPTSVARIVRRGIFDSISCNVCKERHEIIEENLFKNSFFHRQINDYVRVCIDNINPNDLVKSYNPIDVNSFCNSLHPVVAPMTVLGDTIKKFKNINRCYVCEVNETIFVDNIDYEFVNDNSFVHCVKLYPMKEYPPYKSPLMHSIISMYRRNKRTRGHFLVNPYIFAILDDKFKHSGHCLFIKHITIFDDVKCQNESVHVSDGTTFKTNLRAVYISKALD
ncbi:MAG: hypothetical protein KDH96_07055 [Candidatus Riesia sp.]|nr:hypothetical protein [Candidatus Riesia sp.]